MARLLLVVWTMLQISALATVSLDTTGSSEFGAHWQWLGDKPALQKLEEILTLPNEDWVPLESELAQLGFVKNDYWLRMTIDNNTDITDWLFKFSNRGINLLSFWIVSSNGIEHFIIGTSLPFTQSRELALPHINHTISLPKNEQSILYLKVSHDGHLDLNGSITSLKQSLIDTQVVALEELVYFGVFLTLLVYHLILYSTSKEISYLGYSAFVASIMCFFLYVEGYLWWLMPYSPNFANALGQGSISLVSSAAALFSLQYITFPKKSNVKMMLTVIMYVGIFIFAMRTLTPLLPALIFGSVLAGITFLLIPLIALWAYFKTKNPFALIYFYSWSIWSLLAIWTVLTIFGIFDSDTSSIWSSLKGAFAIQSFVLAWSLGFRIRVLNAQRTSAIAESQAKSELIARVSHEIRTPMNGIIGTSQILESHLTSKEANELNEVIYQSGMSLLTIINDLLDLSRLESGNIKLKRAKTNIRKLLDQTQVTLQPQINQKNLAAVNEVSDEVPNCLNIDSARVRQILYNLIGNAIKYTAVGDITISTSYIEEKLIIAVNDTGRGIPKDKISAIFLPYEQVKKSAQEQRSGAGLGLHIASSLAIMMDGEINISSELNVGTTVSLVIPAQSIDSTNDNMEGSENLAPFKPLRCLVADDNQINRTVIKGLLAKIGHSFEIVTNGTEAVSYYFENHEYVDVVLMDCEMPVMDGYDAAQKIREIEAAKHLPSVPIIAVTAHAYEGHLEKVHQSGMDQQLSKPLTKDILAQSLSENTR